MVSIPVIYRSRPLTIDLRDLTHRVELTTSDLGTQILCATFGGFPVPLYDGYFGGKHQKGVWWTWTGFLRWTQSGPEPGQDLGSPGIRDPYLGVDPPSGGGAG